LERPAARRRMRQKKIETVCEKKTLLLDSEIPNFGVSNLLQYDSAE
jgi:hypothetical protein